MFNYSFPIRAELIMYLWPIIGMIVLMRKKAGFRAHSFRFFHCGHAGASRAHRVRPTVRSAI